MSPLKSIQQKVEQRKNRHRSKFDIDDYLRRTHTDIVQCNRKSLKCANFRLFLDMCGDIYTIPQVEIKEIKEIKKCCDNPIAKDEEIATAQLFFCVFCGRTFFSGQTCLACMDPEYGLVHNI